MDVNLKLYTFTLSDLFNKHPLFAMLVYGTRGHGKTKFLQKLMFYLCKVLKYNYKIYTGSDDPEYAEAHLMQEKFDEDNSSIMFYLDELSKKGYENNENNNPLVLLFDDCSAFYRNKELRKILDNLFIEGRHKNIIIILVIHTFSSVTPTVRMQTDLLLLCNAHSEYDKRYIYEFADPIGEIQEDKIIKHKTIKYDEFKEFLYDNLKNYDKLMYDNFNDKWFNLLSKNYTPRLKLRKK